MKKYDRSEKCRKCGHNAFIITWKEYPDEHLKVQCIRCDFKWKRATLDADAKG